MPERGEETILSRHFEDWAVRDPARPFLIERTRRCTYGDARARIRAVSAALAREGILGRGERACLVLDNRIEYVVACFAAMEAGGIAVPMGAQATVRELERVLADCRPAVVIADARRLPAVAESLGRVPCARCVVAVGPGAGGPPERREGLPTSVGGGVPVLDFGELSEGERGSGPASLPAFRGTDPAMIIYTSGTAGRPKGVVLSHRNLLANAESIVGYLRLSRDDRVMVVLPFHYSYGNSLLTTHVRAGGSLVLEDGFLYPKTVLDRMAGEEVTGFAGVPSTFAILLGRARPRRSGLPRLRYVTQAGGPMPPRQALELAAVLPGVRIYIMYGQTEATARLAFLPPEDLHRKPGAIGKPIPGVRLALKKEDGSDAEVGEVGEIVAQGDNVMLGYWNDPEGTARAVRPDGLHTGDLARVDEDGYFHVVGRDSDIIKTGGYRVAPGEVEEVLLEMPSVREAAVVGFPDDLLGEAIAAFVVADPGAPPVPAEILAHCRHRLPPHKMPRRLRFLSSLPRSEAGKVLKRLLREGEGACTAEAAVAGVAG